MDSNMRELVGELTRDALIEHAGRLEDALREIERWGDAYPEDIFIPPTSAQCAEAHEALKAIGYSMDKFAAHAMRHVARGMAKIARDALPDET